MIEEEKNQLSCKDAELLIDESLDGMISLNDKEIMDKHLQNCDNCRKYLSESSELIKKIHSDTKNSVSISAQKKSELWSGVEAKVNFDKHKIEKEASAELSTFKKKEDFFSKYKYYIAGLAAAIIFVFILFGVKNINIDNSRLTQQNTFGIDSYWKVSSLAGSPLIGNIAMGALDSVKEGQWISTNDTSRAQIQIADLGIITIEPNSKVIVVKNAEGNNRIFVEYGTIDADMNPHQKSFFVEMPSAVAKDQGGNFTLTIDSVGDGMVFVKDGKIAVESLNKEAIVPAGNIVMTKKDIGVGTPFNQNSSREFKQAIFKFDFGNCEESCVNTILNNAKFTDAITLANLIPSVENKYKGEVYAKLANFVPPPRQIAKDSLPFMNEAEIDTWVDKIQKQVEENVERSMKDVAESIEHLKNLEFTFDTIQFNNKFEKNWNYKYHPKKYTWTEDSAFFNKEQFDKDMEEMQRELKENAFDQEQFKKDMENLKEDLKEMQEELKQENFLHNEEFKKEMERVKEELKESLKDIDENVKIEIQKSLDSVPGYKYKYKKKYNDEEPVDPTETTDEE